MTAVTPEQAIEVLNRIHAADPTVLPALIAYRVPCNEQLADDPTVQVGAIPAVQPGSGSEPQDGYFEVGVLGIINGLFGVGEQRGYGFISAMYDNQTKQLLCFELTKNP